MGPICWPRRRSAGRRLHGPLPRDPRWTARRSSQSRCSRCTALSCSSTSSRTWLDATCRGSGLRAARSGVHTEHHRQRSYGTEADPEYFPYGRRRPILILISLGASLLAPLALAVRFGVLAPVSWIVPPLGRMVRERASALAINPRFVRLAPISAAGRVEEAAACAVVWMAVSLWWNGHLPTSALACWAATVAVASGVNAVRTLAAHRYDRDEGELRKIDQLVDSCTIDGGRGRRMLIIGHTLVAPLGLRFHALHHWIPSLPYHNLGRAHRRLVATLGGDAPYRATVERGFSPLLRDLVRRSRRSRL
ncbi:MAG: hypothetical protein DMG01_06395 [Acidobacteria bacterium]|nr:MAG: hypothetical protein DMG01_06395 [Acidobacteriota bacterium]